MGKRYWLNDDVSTVETNRKFNFNLALLVTLQLFINSIYIDYAPFSILLLAAFAQLYSFYLVSMLIVQFDKLDYFYLGSLEDDLVKLAKKIGSKK